MAIERTVTSDLLEFTSTTRTIDTDASDHKRIQIKAERIKKFAYPAQQIASVPLKLNLLLCQNSYNSNAIHVYECIVHKRAHVTVFTSCS